MGILEKNKKSTKSAFNSTTSSNVYKNGSKKASYSLSVHNESENIDPKEKTNEILAEQDEIYHDNPAFEPELANQEQTKNPFDTESSKKGSLTNESFQLETHNQTSISTLASISNTEKLAAAAAAAVSSTAASLVQVPNFGQELSTMMKQNRMDEIEIGSKKTDSSIVQNNGFAYGDGGSMNNKNMKKSPSSNAIGDLATLDDDAKLKLTGTSASYDIKIRQRRACHLKVLVILIAMLTAGFIGCIFTYYYMRYQIENQKYLSYTQNMVLERASKLGSNKLEIVVPFGTNVTDINDKNILVNKIEEIVHQTFTRMNKTVDLMQLYELNEIAANWYVATIDVELKDASDFSNVVLRKESETRIKIDDSSHVLKAFRDNFLNVTLGLNIIPEILSINASNVEILYDFKVIYAALNSTELATVAQTNPALAKEKLMPNPPVIEITKTNSPKLPSSIVSSTPSLVSESAIYFASSPPQPDTGAFTSAPSIPPSLSSQLFEPLSTSLPPLTTPQPAHTSPLFFTNGVSRILSTTMSPIYDTSSSVEPSFLPKVREENIELINYKAQNDRTKFNSPKNEKEIEENFRSSSTPVLATDGPTNKILIAEILLNNEEEFDSSAQDAETQQKVDIGTKSYSSEKFPLKSSTSVPFDGKDSDGLDIVLQIDGNDSSLLNRFFEKKNRK